ncbi:MAG: CSLREA domain-containing protein [Chloroflexi bacterium]|nr:CSLREA domain-containing protein [Chloroflexota bacterium]
MRRTAAVVVLLSALTLLSSGAQRAPLPPPVGPDVPLVERAQYDMAAYQQLMASGTVATATIPPATEPVITTPRATFIVISTEDTPDPTPGDGQCNPVGGCTLRAAIMEANALGGAVITFAPDIYDVTLAFSDVADVESNGDLDVTGTVFVVGLPDRRITIHAQPNRRGIEVAPGGVLHLSRIAIEGGSAGTENGGCLAVQAGASALLDHVTLHGCSAYIGGGAYVGSGAFLRASHSAITDNTARAISGVGSSTADSGAHVRLEYTEVSGNLSTEGAGAIHIHSGLITLDHVTVAYNTTEEDFNGAGVVVTGITLTEINDSTIAYNTATQTAAGLQVLASNPPIVRRTIIANNVRTFSGQPVDCTGSGSSLAQLVVLDTSIGGTGCGNVAGPPSLLLTGVDPRVSPVLEAYGATNGTRTLALLPDSPAVDAGGDPCGLHDQRGLPISGEACDLGAYELQVQSRGADTNFENGGGCGLSTPWKSKLTGDKPVNSAPIAGVCSFRFKGKGSKAATPGSLKFKDNAPVTPGSVDGFRWTFTAQTTTATAATWKVKVVYVDGTSDSWTGAIPAIDQTGDVLIGDLLPAGKPPIAKVVYKLTDRTLSGTWQLDDLGVWLTRSG